MQNKQTKKEVTLKWLKVHNRKTNKQTTPEKKKLKKKPILEGSGGNDAQDTTSIDYS